MIVRSLLLLLFLTLCVSAQVPLGATKQEVINLIGWPSSTSKAGEREILNYPDFTVVLEKNQMTNLQFKPGKRKPLSSYVVPQPKVTPPPVRSPSPNTEPIRPINADPINPRKNYPSIAEPTRSIPPPAPASDPLASTRFAVMAMLALFVVVVVTKTWLGKSRQKRNREVNNPFPRPASKTPKQEEPPLVVRPRETPAKPDPIKDGWSLALLKEMEWHRFEQVVAAYERALGNDAELTDFGPDGGVDVRVFEKGSRIPKRVIQCKAFGAQQVGVEHVRSFFGVIILEKCPHGAFYTTSTFTEAALAVANAEPTIELVNGTTFLNRIQHLKLSSQLQLFEVATKGDYKTPTCPSCGVKMITQTINDHQAESGREKWCCPHFPRCRQKPMAMKLSA